jgi:dTMP kinase
VLCAFEGIDGAGKSTQVDMLRRWLLEKRIPVVVSEWNSSKLVHGALRDAKRARQLTPRTYSLFHALDFADRYERRILPALASQGVVICDRYIYTAFTRDAARGLYSRWLQAVYAYARKPDLIFYLKIPVELALCRIQESRMEGKGGKGKSKIKFYEAGLDMKLSPDPARSFRIFQRRIIGEYDRLAPLIGFTVIDGAAKAQVQHQLIREAVQGVLDGTLDKVGQSGA